MSWYFFSRAENYGNRGVARLITLFSFFVGILLITPNITFSATIEELRAKIEDRNARIQEIEAEIAKYQKELSITQGQKTNLQNAIKQLDILRQKFLTDIKLTETKITSTNLQIQKLNAEITDKEKSIDTNSAALGEAIRKIDQFSLNSLIEDFLAYNNIGDYWNILDTLGTFQKTLQENISQLRQLKTALASDKEKSEENKQKLVSYKVDLSDQKKIVDSNKAEKDRLLLETKNKETAYQALIAEKEKNKEAFEKEIFEFESAIKFELDPSRIPPAGFGVLSWPLDSVFITQRFGKTVDARRLYTSGTHNGVDFRALVGTKVKATLSGTIQALGDTDKVCPNASYGKWVLLKHANGLSSLYAHLDMISVSAGQIVATGERIGYSGSTGYSTGPHVHLTVFANQGVQVSSLPSIACKGAVYTIPVANPAAYLDPLEYL